MSFDDKALVSASAPLHISSWHTFWRGNRNFPLNPRPNRTLNKETVTSHYMSRLNALSHEKTKTSYYMSRPDEVSNSKPESTPSLSIWVCDDVLSNGEGKELYLTSNLHTDTWRRMEKYKQNFWSLNMVKLNLTISPFGHLMTKPKTPPIFTLT